MAKIIDLKEEEQKLKSRLETILHFIETEMKGKDKEIEINVNRLSKDIIKDIQVIKGKKREAEELFKINLDYDIGYAGIDSIELSKPEYLEFVYQFAKKYEDLITGRKEVVIYK